MNCRDINNYIFLKEDELTANELAELKKHIAVCPSCAKGFSEAARTNELIGRLKTAEPFLTEGVLFTSSVMEAIDKPGTNSFISDMLDKVSLLFIRTAVRAAAVSAIIIIVSTFLVQQYSLFSNVSNLENKLAISSIAPAAQAQMGYGELKAIKLAVDFYELFKGEKLYAGFSKNLILADKEKLNEFLNLYSDLQNYRNLYDSEIKEKYPELNSFLEKKLSIEELQDFVKKNENLIKELSRKLPAGGK